MSLCFLSLETNKLFNRLILKEIEKYGYENLSESLIVLFPFIDANKDITISQLSREVGYSRQAMHKNIKKLESLGYIDLSSGNQKEKKISLTKKGIQLIKVANDYIISIQNGLEKLVGKDKIEEYIKSQTLIYEFLQSKQ